MFWGTKLKPKKPYFFEECEDGKRLHLSQATLGSKTGDKRCIIKVKADHDGEEIAICSLKAGLNETCPLDIYLEEPALISVVGGPVYLSGYVDIAEDDDNSDYEDDSEDPEDDSFIMDEDEEDDESEDEDMDVRPRSNVKIVDIDEEEEEKEKAKSGKKLLPATPETPEAEKKSESEDEDGLPVANKRKKDAEEAPLSKKKKTGSEAAAATPAATPATTPATPESGKKKNKKEKKAAQQQQQAEQKAAVVKAEEKSAEKPKSAKKHGGARKFPNGLEIEETEMGKPDGKQAQTGKKVSIRYIGKLKSNGKIFDSTVGKKPFQFRLGVNEVVKGFDVGVMGMRVGDKRRVTIPPVMGYGSKAVQGIPPGSWLVFDIELVDVKG